MQLTNMEILYSFFDIRFWLFFLYFLITIFIVFYIPGNVFIRWQKFSLLSNIVLSFILGIVLFSFQGLLFGYLGIRWLSYIYLLGMGIFWIKGIKISKLSLPKQIIWKKLDPVLFLLIVLGIIIQVSAVWFIGYRSNNGLEFCCFWPDSFYHLALVNELVRSFPPYEPGMYDLIVKNYHYLANLVVADLVRLFRLPLIHTQYQYMPVFLSVLMAGSLVSIGELVSKEKSFTRWLVFFIFFGGDIIFLLLFLLGKGPDFTINVSENATTLWFSPPRVYGMVILFGGIYLFLSFIKKPSRVLGILLGLLFGSLVGFKIYLGFFALFGLGIVLLYSFLKRQFAWGYPFITAGLISALLYLPINTGAGGLFFSGLWRINDFAVRPIFGLMNMVLAKQVYEQHKNFLRIGIIETIFFGLYIFSLFGVYLIGFVQSRTSLKQFPLALHIFLLSGLTASFILGMFFLQETGGANTLQFLFSVYIVGAFYTALALSYWLNKIPNRIKLVLISVVVLLASARVIRETYHNASDIMQHKEYFTIANEELAALAYVKNAIHKDANVAVESKLAFSDTCYYLSFIADRRFFLCGSGILEDHGADIEQRVAAETTMFLDENVSRLSDAIEENHIDYIYVPAGFLFGTNQTRDFLLPVYKNSEVEILRVDKEKIKDL
jgi:hypothetical protein